MTTYFLEPPSQLLDAAKQAAFDAVAGYEHVNRYTVGIAVQAAAAVLRTDVHPPSNRVSPDPWDVASTEVTPRLRLLESLAEVVRSAHSPAAHPSAEPCPVCATLRELERAS